MYGPATAMKPGGAPLTQQYLTLLQSKTSRSGKDAIKIGFVSYMETVNTECMDEKGKIHLHLSTLYICM